MPDDHFDTIIAGAGLAGASAALYLSPYERVLVLEGEKPAAGASGAAAGLINPLMGRKAKPVNEIDASLEAIRQTLDRADASGLFHEAGVVRPARTEQQAKTFREVADHYPDHARWLAPETARERYPTVTAPCGALLVRRGGWLDTARFIRAMLTASERHGAILRTHAPIARWGEEKGHAYVTLRSTRERISAKRLVLALGAGALSFKSLSPLHLRGVKGQTIRVERSEGLVDLPPLSGSGYVVPKRDHLILGSSYEHTYEDLSPSEEQTAYILEKTARMVPALEGARVLDATAGVRVYAGHYSRPWLDRAPGSDHVWVFTGLGSRGLLTAPRLAAKWALEQHAAA